MKRLIQGITAFSLLAGPALASSSDWSSLDTFAGTYPAAGLMKSAIIRQQLRNLLSPRQRAQLKAMAVSPPVSKIDSDLMAQFCMPHMCGSESAVLVIDPAAAKLWVGFYETDGKRVQMEWIGTDDPAALPPDIQASLAKIHNPF
ncbi:hypothetical protein [Acidocella facilis]|uniref:hypothetical protein n=1 Tax=Acidocella facilis TaxID=525 RepID=UPI0012DC1493|nr:hypothetical protein [Acidocella facilis]